VIEGSRRATGSAVSFGDTEKEEKMPRGDGTGPAGLGPMTGRRMGYCAGYGMPGYMHGGWGRGFGRGGGRGRGWRHWYYATGLPGWARGRSPWGPVPFAPPAGWPQDAPEEIDDAEALREQAQYLEEALANVRKRLDEIGTGGGE
jgi:hypothetical protein